MNLVSGTFLKYVDSSGHTQFYMVMCFPFDDSRPRRYQHPNDQFVLVLSCVENKVVKFRRWFIEDCMQLVQQPT